MEAVYESRPFAPTIRADELALSRALDADVCSRACDARDSRFDGLFFVAITTTRIYCRPVCPARVSHRDRRRFYASAAAAEQAGYRPCLRCRPELAPGFAESDAVPRLAAGAARRVAEGALNGRSVQELASEFGVSARHLRRAFERELGVSPVQLALTHRLLFAKRLLADTELSVTRIAYASGFQSLRRFNAACQERYRLPPTALRRPARLESDADSAPQSDFLRLTLSYRAPLAWDAMLACLAQDAIPGIDRIDGRRYGRTVSIEGRSGMIFAEDSVSRPHSRSPGSAHLDVDVSVSLVPVLMPLLARLRQLFDLDAEPTVIDAHLARHGLGRHVRRRPGMRIPGTISGFEVAVRVLLGGWPSAGDGSREQARRFVAALGEPLDSGSAGLDRLFPTAEDVAEAGEAPMRAVQLPRGFAETIVALARAIIEGDVHLTAGRDPVTTQRALLAIPGIDEHAAAMIVMRALSWPDVFDVVAPAQPRAGISPAAALPHARAGDWRPWRSYAALHLWSEKLLLSSDATRRPAPVAVRLPAPLREIDAHRQLTVPDRVAG